MKTPLCPKGGDDRVYTPPRLAEAIVRHFRPSGHIHEPCSGKDAFVDALNKWRRPSSFVTSSELDKGRDFFQFSVSQDWIVTNPPWSQLRAFLQHSMMLADNIVFLCPTNALLLKARYRDMQQAKFGIVEILTVPTPPLPWPQSGFLLGAHWLRRGWTGATSWSSLGKI